MREKMLRFMAGRNGNDDLNRFLLVADLLLLLLSSLIRNGIGHLLMILTLMLIGVTYFRMFSRDLLRRGDENARYLREKQKVMSNIRLWKERWSQRKEYKFFTCPACKATMRVPRGRGKIRIVCRKCGNSFSGKS